MCQHAFLDQRSAVKNRTLIYLQRIQSDFVQSLKDSVIRRLDRKLADLHLNHNLLSQRNKIRREYVFYKEGVARFEKKAYALLGQGEISEEEQGKLSRYRTQLAESKVKLASFTEKMFEGLDNVKAGWFQSEFKSLEACLEKLSISTTAKNVTASVADVTSTSRASRNPPSSTKQKMSEVDRALREANMYIKTCTDTSTKPSYVRIKHTIIQNFGDDVFAKIKEDVRAACAACSTIIHTVEHPDNIVIKTSREKPRPVFAEKSRTTKLNHNNNNNNTNVPIKEKRNTMNSNLVDFSTTMSSEEEEEEEEDVEDEDNGSESDESEGLDMSLALLTFGSIKPTTSIDDLPKSPPFSSSSAMSRSSLKSPRERKKRTSSKRTYVVDFKPSHVPLSAPTSNSSHSNPRKRRSNSSTISPAVSRALTLSRDRRNSTSRDSLLGSFSTASSPDGDDALSTPLWSTSQFDDLFVGETKHFSPDTTTARDGNKIINTTSTITL